MLSFNPLSFSHYPLSLPLRSLQHPPRVKTLVRVSPNAKLRPDPAAPRLKTTRTGIAAVPSSRAVAGSETPNTAAPPEIPSASDVVREFYDRINHRELAAVEPLISEGCVYEDLIFSQPFVGRKAILEFFKKFTESVSEDLKFVIDDISQEDTSAIGVTWHLDFQGRAFPFSKGCSFYRLEVLNGKRQIVYGRDCVEPALKPGEIALVLIGGVTWILQRFPQLAKRL